MWGPKEIERWLGSDCYWGKRRWWDRGSVWEKWKCLIICPSVTPSLLPYYLSCPVQSSHFLSTVSSLSRRHTLLSFFFSPSPTYLICIHLLSDLLCRKTANYLICLFPPSFHLFSPLMNYLSNFSLFLSPSLPVFSQCSISFAISPSFSFLPIISLTSLFPSSVFSFPP